MINRRRTDGQTDGQTDTQKFGGYNIIPRHFLWRGIKKTRTVIGFVPLKVHFRKQEILHGKFECFLFI